MQTGNLHVSSEYIHQRTLSSTGRTHNGSEMSRTKETIYAFQYCSLSYKMKIIKNYAKQTRLNYLKCFKITQSDLLNTKH